MNIQISQLKKLYSFLEYFFPQLDFKKKELDKEDADRLLYYLVIIIDTLVKSENLYKKRNFILPDNKSFFSKETVAMMENLNIFLFRFDTRIFSFTRTERQTFVFIIENIIDYHKRSGFYTSEKDQKNLFIDYRFWIENFFKMFNQKITGSIYSNKKNQLKSFFHSNDISNNELIFSNTSVNFSISPFAINRDNKNLFLSNVNNGQLTYTDACNNTEIIIKDEQTELKVFEFLFSNFNFEQAAPFKAHLKKEGHILLEKGQIVETACNYHKEHLYQESQNLLKDLAFETIDLPLVYLLQVRNFVTTSHIFEAKKVLQKFILLYPFYADGYEIMGDIYLNEENYDMALNFYEKVLKLTQSKRIAEKLKRVRDEIEKNKEKTIRQKNENFFDISEAVFQANDRFIERDKEIRQMIEILLSHSRRNLLLVGDSGVGKTSLVKMLASRILDRDVPEPLRDIKLEEINFVSLLTGSKYRGQFEEKVLKLLSDFKNQKAILILEDIHLMIASGVPRGTSLDLINILKQFLRENSVQVIATTDYDEFKNTVEKDSSLMSFFQKLTVNEMSPDNTKRVLRNLAEDIFAREKIIIAENIIDQVVESARRDIRDKRCPDAAVMIFERTVAKIKCKIHAGQLNKFEVEPSDVAETISDMLNLPETNIPLSLKQRLSSLKGKLLKEIVGQDDAIERMVACITTAKLNFDIKRNRPDGVFLFIGPTGVGKTETALALSRALYGSEDYLIRIDMSEYMEKYTYSRFVGAAPGYVGYMDSNQLTDKVRQNPFTIILLDEIEKADSQLLNIFLQVFDAGRLTDARGNIVDFSHATIIMTSNIGTSLFSRVNMGYQGELEPGNVSHNALIKALKKYFSPEFLNRLDEVMIFNHLNNTDIKKIINLQLATVRENLEKEEKELIIREEVMDFIVHHGYSQEYGARHIGRVLRKHILEKLALLSLEKDWEYSRHIICSTETSPNGEETVAIHLESEEALPLEPNKSFMQDFEQI